MNQTPGQTISRRNFLSRVVASIIAAVAAILGIPIVGYILSPARAGKAGEAELTEVGDANSFTVGQPTQTSFISTIMDGWVTSDVARTVWVVRRGAEDFTVYNSHCTHAGCAYSWHPEAQNFQCPCHAGVFDVNGRVLSGPPPRPLDTLDWKIENGKLLIDYQDFVAGTPQKIPLV